MICMLNKHLYIILFKVAYSIFETQIICSVFSLGSPYYFILYFASLHVFHLAVCLTTGPKSLPKRALHIVRSRASSFKWEYPLLSLRSSSSFLHPLPCLPVTSIPPCIFPSVTRYRRQFLRKMWPIQFAFRLRISCGIFPCSLTVSNTSSFLTWSVQLIFSILLQHHISKLARCFWPTARSVQVTRPYTYIRAKTCIMNWERAVLLLTTYWQNTLTANRRHV
jgi:hypothetical protein